MSQSTSVYPNRLVVFGRGRVGSLLAEGAALLGAHVESCDISDWQQTLAAVEEPFQAVFSLNRGLDAVDILRHCASIGTAPVAVLDLTTHSTVTSEQAAAEALAIGCAYHGGGLTGGVAGVADRNAVFFVGPGHIDRLSNDLLDAFGTTSYFKSTADAVAVKLLHNLVLLVHSWGLAQAMQLSRDRGITDAQMAHAIRTGPAGRPIDSHSQFRDMTKRGESSYFARQALKDLDQMLESFPTLSDNLGGLAELTRSVLGGSEPDVPFTDAFTQAAMQGDNRDE